MTSVQVFYFRRFKAQPGAGAHRHSSPTAEGADSTVSTHFIVGLGKRAMVVP